MESSDAPEQTIKSAISQKIGVRKSCRIVMLSPSSTRRSMGQRTKLKALQKGRIAHRIARIRQRAIPNSTKNSVEPRITPTEPQQ